MTKRRRMRTPVKILLGAAALAVLAAAGFMVRETYRNRLQETEKQEIYDAMTLEAQEASLKIDCGTDFDIRTAVRYSGGELTAEGNVDTGTVGSYPLILTLSRTTSWGETVSRSFPVTVEVRDNTVPEIVLNEEVMELQAGADPAEIASNVASVTDGKDGDLTRSETETAGTYCIATDADLDTPGEYTVTVTALDLDGHRAETEFRLVVNKVPENENPYRIRVNRELNTVTVYSRDADGNYTIPLKAMVCSTGAATPVGVFHTFNRSTWRALFGGVYGQYATDIVGDILFHSVPYYSMNKGDVEYLEYNKLGTKASLGCIRLAVSDALWIFNNCPIGTEVEIYDDPGNPGPLGKPEPSYIDPESENRGWDPTDPDPANPWNY